MPPNLTSAMTQEVRRIIAAAASNTMTVDVQFYNSLGRVALSHVTFPNNLRIIQDTLTNYTDDVQLSIELPVDQYQSLLRNAKDLHCRLTIQQHNPLTNKPGDIWYRHEFYVVIHQRNPLSTTYTAAEVISATNGDSGLVTMDMDLIDTTMYRMRKQEFHFIARDATIKDVIRYIAKQLNIQRIHLVPPDNTTRYRNFVIPPSHNLASCIEFLQNSRGYGIYQRGVSFYASGNVLYIYPAHDTRPTYGTTTHLYNVGTTNARGLESNHRFDTSNNLHILIPGQIEHETKSQWDIENLATGRVVVHTQNHIDHSRTMSSGIASMVKNYGTFRHDAETGILSSNEVSSGKLVASANNPYVHASHVASAFVDKLACAWPHAIPLSIKPGHRLIFHCDIVEPDALVPVTKHLNGVMEKCVYELRLLDIAGPRLFGCTATLQLGIEPTEMT